MRDEAALSGRPGGEPMPEAAKRLAARACSERAAELLEDLVERLEAGWRRGRPETVEELMGAALEVPADERPVLLCELLLTDIEYRVQARQPVCFDSYLRRYPELIPEASALATLAVKSAPRGGEPFGRLGKFELRELVGSGSFGEVYKARDTQLRRDVAIKTPRRDRLPTDDDGERFLREARHAAHLRHPRIVPILDAGKIDGVYYLACAYMPGGTLQTRLNSGALPFREAAEIVAQVAEALDYAHREGVVHRDVKPANILFDVDGRPCLADFGLAKTTAADATLTLREARAGTPAFMSPEQLAGDNRRVGPRSDVYSLGVVLYELLTRRLPFLGRGRMLEIEVLNDEPKPPRRLDEHVPIDLESVCLMAMAKEPCDRYATAGKLADDLRRYLAGEPVTARPIGALRRATRCCRRQPALAGLAAALMATVVVGFGAVAWQWRRAESHLELSRRNVRQAHAAIRGFDQIVAEAGRDRDPESRPLRRKLLERSVEYYRDFLRQLPDDDVLRADVAHALYEIGFAAYTVGHKERADEAFQESLPLWAQLAKERGDDRETLYFLGRVHYMLGLLRKESHPLDALRRFDQTRVVRERLVRLFPDDDALLHDLIEVQETVGAAVFRRGDHDKGFEAVRSAIKLRLKLVERHPGHSEYGRRLADTQRAHASMFHEIGRLDEAETLCREAASLAAAEAAAERGMPYAATTQAEALLLLTRILLKKGDVQMARAICRRGRDILPPLAAKYPSYAKVRDLLADMENELRKIDAAEATACADDVEALSPTGPPGPR